MSSVSQTLSSPSVYGIQFGSLRIDISQKPKPTKPDSVMLYLDNKPGEVILNGEIVANSSQIAQMEQQLSQPWLALIKGIIRDEKAREFGRHQALENDFTNAVSGKTDALPFNTILLIQDPSIIKSIQAKKSQIDRLTLQQTTAAPDIFRRISGLLPELLAGNLQGIPTLPERPIETIQTLLRAAPDKQLNPFHRQSNRIIN